MPACILEGSVQVRTNPRDGWRGITKRSQQQQQLQQQQQQQQQQHR